MHAGQPARTCGTQSACAPARSMDTPTAVTALVGGAKTATELARAMMESGTALDRAEMQVTKRAGPLTENLNAWSL